MYNRREGDAAYDVTNVKESETTNAYENFAFGDISVPAPQHVDVKMDQNPAYFTVHY